MKDKLTKKIEERNIVKKYLKNDNIAFEECDIISNSEQNSPIDVFWKNIKFQVAYADGELEKPRRTIDKRGNFAEFGRGRQIDEYFQSIIVKPLEKHKFGKAAKGIVCLLFCVSQPPFINDLKESFEDLILDAELEQYFFDKIKLVCPNKNYQLYPLYL